MQKTKIDWADMTWNPVTGCLHGCEYCYARRIANRFASISNEATIDDIKDTLEVVLGFDEGEEFKIHGECIELIEPVCNFEARVPYPFNFRPTLHCYRLDEPQHIRRPQTIFVCSMGELFGEWVPTEWILEVFEACDAAPQHRYLFLTKNPRAYKHDPVWSYTTAKGNWWFGASITGTESQNKIWDVLIGLAYCENSFLSIEPIHGSIEMPRMARMPKLIIVGAETGNRKDKPVVCKWWIDEIVETCRERKASIFMKESLRNLMGADFIQEFPWGDER